MILYHFTCIHSARSIKQSRILRPVRQPAIESVYLTWLTDLEDPSRWAVGLTQTTIACDRMQYRVTVEAEVPKWTDFARLGTPRFRKLARYLNETGMPQHWYVAEERLPILRIESWRGRDS